MTALLSWRFSGETLHDFVSKLDGTGRILELQMRGLRQWEQSPIGWHLPGESEGVLEPGPAVS
jgi:hypothetical protein